MASGYESTGEDEVVARNSLWKQPLLLAACLLIILLVALGPETFGLRPKPGWQFIGWPAALCMAIASVVVARRILNRSPQLVIDQSGIFMRRWSKDIIPWAALRQISVERLYGPWFSFARQICLYLHDQDAYPRTAAAGATLGRGWNLGFGDITMMTAGLDHDVEDVWEAIERFAPASVELDGSQMGRGGPRRKRG